MGGILLLLVLNFVISFGLLVVTMAIAQKIVDISMPPWGETLWKLAVIVVAVAVANIMATLLVTPVVGPFAEWIGFAVGLATLFIFLNKWFDADLLASIVIAVVNNVVTCYAGALLAGALR